MERWPPLVGVVFSCACHKPFALCYPEWEKFFERQSYPSSAAFCSWLSVCVRLGTCQQVTQCYCVISRNTQLLLGRQVDICGRVYEREKGRGREGERERSREERNRIVLHSISSVSDITDVNRNSSVHRLHERYKVFPGLVCLNRVDYVCTFKCANWQKW